MRIDSQNYRMFWPGKCLLIALLGLSAMLEAQVITPSLPGKPQHFPLVFPADEAGNTVLLFFAREHTAPKGLLFQTAVVGAANDLLKTNAVVTIQTLESAAKEITPLCLFADQSNRYALFQIGDRDIYQVNIEPVNQNISAQAIGQLDAREQLLGGMTVRQGAVIITRSTSGEHAGSLHIYQPQGGALKKSSFHQNLPDFLTRSNYTPLLVQSGADMWPNKAIHPDKIIADGSKIYFLHDKTPNIYSSEVLKLQLVTIDLDADTLYSQTLDYPNQGQTIMGASGSSYIFESRLFQIYFDHQKFGLLVRNLPDQTMLFEQYMAGSDSLFLIQSPVDFWGGRKLEKPKVSTLLRRLKSALPYIYVKRYGKELILGMGGFTESLQRGSDGGPNDPNLATPLRPAGEISVVFYSSMREDGRQLSNHRFGPSPVTRIYQELSIPKNGVFKTINGQSKYLYYDRLHADQPFSLILLDMKDQ